MYNNSDDRRAIQGCIYTPSKVLYIRSRVCMLGAGQSSHRKRSDSGKALTVGPISAKGMLGTYSFLTNRLSRQPTAIGHNGYTPFELAE